MTSEKNLTEEFFRVFGIEPKYTYIGHYPLTDKNGIIQPPKYPEITAKKLLRMVCILNKHYAENFQCATMLVGDTIEKIKECVLKDCIEQSQHIKTEIQQLFSE